MNLFNLIATLTLDRHDYDKGIDDAKKETTKFEKSTSKSNVKAGKSFLKLIAVITALVVIMKKLISSSITYGNAVADNAKQLGISTDAYQLWSAAVKAAGGDTDTINSAFSTMNDLLASASEGEGDATAKLNELGLTYADFAGLSAEESFEKIFTALQSMTDETAKTQAAQDLFGDDVATYLIPLLDSNSMTVQELMDYYSSLGIVMGEDDVTAADKLASASSVLGTQWKAVGDQLMTGLYPVLEKLMTWLSDLATWINTHKAAFDAILTAICAGILAITVALIKLNAIPVVAAISLIVVALAALVVGITNLVKNWDEVENYFTQAYNSGWLKWMKTAVEAVETWFTSLVSFFKTLGSKISSIFSDMWEGIKSSFKSFCNYFIDGMNSLISGLNKISFTMPDWMGGAHFGINIPLIPRLQKGADFIPNDFYPAYLDYGERVLTKTENEKYSALGGTDGMSALVNGIGGAVRSSTSGGSQGDIKVYVQIGEKQFDSYVYKIVNNEMKKKGYKSLKKVGSY